MSDDPLKDQIVDYFQNRDPPKDLLDYAKRDWARYRDPTALLTLLAFIAMIERYSERYPHSRNSIIPDALDFAREVIEDLRRNPVRTDLDKDRDIRRWQRDVRWSLRVRGFKPRDQIPGTVLDEIAQIARRSRKRVAAYISTLKKDNTPES